MGLGLLSQFFGGGGKPRRKRISLTKRFAIHGPLGNGSMSKVYRATDRELGREVCLKILDKQTHAQLIARFPGLKRPEEGEIAITLSHPNVVRTFDWGWTLKDEQFLSMERIEGFDLTSIVHTESKRPLNRRLGFLIDAARGLAYFHEQGYIHRDISPKNVLINQHGIAKLIDFGLYVPNKPEFRRPGNRTGTLRYMAPELIKRLQTDHRIDIFSFGVTAYEVLSGGLPWEGADESMQEALQHVNVVPRDPRELNPHLDRETAEVVVKALEREPSQRYQTMSEFADALETLLPKVIDESKLKGSRTSKSGDNPKKEPRKP